MLARLRLGRDGRRRGENGVLRWLTKCEVCVNRVVVEPGDTRATHGWHGGGKCVRRVAGSDAATGQDDISFMKSEKNPSFEVDSRRVS